MAAQPPIPFFTDNDVANSVGDAIVAAGHQLTRLRDCMLDDSPDEVVATACRAGGLVLVTHNYKDFRRIIRDEMAATGRQADGLCRVELRCKQLMGAARITSEMPFIELEWARFLANPAYPLRIEINDASTRLGRDWLRDPTGRS